MPIFARPLTPDALRVTHTDGQTPPPDRPWLSHVLLPQPHLLAADCALYLGEQDGRWRILRRSGTCVLSGLRTAEAQPATPALTFQTAPDEGFYGLGQWFNAFRRTAGTVWLNSRESQEQYQHRQTYSNIPLLLSSRGYGLLLLNSHRSRWTFDPAAQTLTISAAGPPLDYVVFAGPTLKAVIEQYTALTGRPPLIPRWGFGLWVTGYPQEPQPVVEQRVAEHRQRRIPLDGVILDYHWEQGFHTFQWRRSLFPDPAALIATLRQHGVRLGLIFTPFMNRSNTWVWRAVLQLLLKNVSAGEFRADDRAPRLYAEGKARGYFAHPNVWWWLGRGGMLDFTNEAAAAWWNALLRPRYQEGVALFKNDDGEYLPDSATSAIGIDGREHHNMYGFFYGRAIFQGMRQLDDRRPLIYARSVWVGSQRYPALFLGDQRPTFAHIRATLRAGLNMSLLGFSYWTPDVFGLDGKTTEETHMRYAQWALLAPIARYFWRPPQLDDTRLPWSHSQRAEANFRAIAELRYQLLPTFCALAWQAHRSGLPIIRPLLLEFPDDERFADCADQYMLGDGLLVAPVVQADATSREVALPAGTWHDLWSLASYTGGGAIRAAAPLERLPILARGGTITLFGPVLQSIPDSHRLDQITARCWPPYPAEATLWDDDGRSRAYERGAFSQTQISAGADGQVITVQIGAADGEFAEQPSERLWQVVLERCPPVTTVRVNRQTTPVDYDPQTLQLRVALNVATTASATIQITLV